MSKEIKYAELSALKGLLRERKTPYREMAKMLGITKTTFSNRINGHSLFDAVEVDIIAGYFNIKPSEMCRYFFPRRTL